MMASGGATLDGSSILNIPSMIMPMHQTSSASFSTGSPVAVANTLLL
jgi:hypothetical protein